MYVWHLVLIDQRSITSYEAARRVLARDVSIGKTAAAAARNGRKSSVISARHRFVVILMRYARHRGTTAKWKSRRRARHGVSGAIIHLKRGNIMHHVALDNYR